MKSSELPTVSAALALVAQSHHSGCNFTLERSVHVGGCLFWIPLPGRYDQATCGSGLANERGWLGHDCVVRVDGRCWESFAELQPALHLFLLCQLHWFKNSLSFFYKDGSNLVCWFSSSWMPKGLSLQLDGSRKKESFREDINHCVMYLCTKLVLLVQTLPALRFGTLGVGVVNGVSEAITEQHLNPRCVPRVRQCICNKLQVEFLLFLSLSHSTPFN